ncbi:MAG: hypothetical protein HC927_00705 [Deltaproteobacteria bacterium]|nr:hypothetical protein [Deltaproteobacteria bacterium]
MREIVDKRLSPAEQEALFGSAHRERIDRLIDRSGGYPRELIKFLREAVELEHPLSEHAFELLLADRAGHYCRLVPDDAIPLLRDIHNTQPRLRLPRSNADTAELTDMLLANNLLMLYQNHDEWTDVNPAIVSLLDAEPDDA